MGCTVSAYVDPAEEINKCFDNENYEDEVDEIYNNIKKLKRILGKNKYPYII